MSTEKSDSEKAPAAVVVRFDKNGVASYFINGDVDVYVIDDRTPNDRIYEMTKRVSPDAVESMLVGPIGFFNDGKFAALGDTPEELAAYLKGIEDDERRAKP